jgi:hypothetical protein
MQVPKVILKVRQCFTLRRIVGEFLEVAEAHAVVLPMDVTGAAHEMILPLDEAEKVGCIFFGCGGLQRPECTCNCVPAGADVIASSDATP